MLTATHPLSKSFAYAFEGLKEAISKGRNYRIQTGIAAVAIFLGFYLGLSTTEWIILTITIAFVLILELINTAVEAIVDLVSPEIKAKAKVAKDVSAAAVLLAAIASVIVGVLLFYPKL